MKKFVIWSHFMFYVSHRVISQVENGKRKKSIPNRDGQHIDFKRTLFMTFYDRILRRSEDMKRFIFFTPEILSPLRHGNILVKHLSYTIAQ